MITVHGHRIDLPATLMPCTHCDRGDLTWNEQRRSWLCTGTWVTPAGTPRRCKHGLSISGIFDSDVLEYRLQLHTPLQHLALTTYAVQLLHAGVISFSWISRRRIEALHAQIPEIDLMDAEFDALDRLVREHMERREEVAP